MIPVTRVESGWHMYMKIPLPASSYCHIFTMKSLFSGFTATNGVNLLFDVLISFSFSFSVTNFSLFSLFALIFDSLTQHRSPWMQLHQTVRFIRSKLRLCSTLNHSCDDWTSSHCVAHRGNTSKWNGFFFTTDCSLARRSVVSWCWRPFLRSVLMSTICTSLIDFRSVSERKPADRSWQYCFALR